MAGRPDVRSMLGGFHLDPTVVFGRRMVLIGDTLRLVTAGEHVEHIVRCAHNGGRIEGTTFCAGCASAPDWERGAASAGDGEGS